MNALRTGRWACSPLLLLLLAAVSASGAMAAPDGKEKRAKERAQGHGSITEQMECSACHTTDGWRSTVDGSGVAKGTGFDHDRTGFPLRGQHDGALCTDCHQKERTLTRECRGCHEDAHQGRLNPDCSQCHNANSWFPTDAIEQHRYTRLPLTGMHAVVDCVDCHRRASDRMWSSVQADCFSCHFDDYRRSDVHPVHTGSATAPAFDRNCGTCHRASGWSPAVIPIGLFDARLTASPLSIMAQQQAPPDHDMRFPLSFGPHRGATCSDCHVRESGQGPVRCVGCHAHNPQSLRAQHRGSAPPSAGQACLSCHVGGAPR